MTNLRISRNVLTILGGTTVALAIPLFFSPVISRLFSPDAFGQLALYVSVVSIAAIAATGRYELAILLPRRHLSAFYLVVVAITLAGIFCLAFAFVSMLVWLLFPQWLESNLSVATWCLLMPTGVFVLSAVQTLNYWQTRSSRYSTVAQSRAGQAIVMTGVQSILGFMSGSPVFLIVGYISGSFAALIKLLGTGWQEFRLLFKHCNWRRLRSIAMFYRDIPKFMVAGHLANVVSSQLPVLMLATLYGPKQAGWYALAERVSVIPCGVIANSVGEVYRQEAAKQYQQHGQCLSLFLRTKGRLALLGAVPAIGFALLAPSVFGLIFGTAWGEAGQVAAILSIVIFFQSISSPLSQTVLLAAMYRLDLIWQFFRLSLTVIALYAGYSVFGDYQVSILFYALVMGASYLIHSVIQYRAARGA